MASPSHSVQLAHKIWPRLIILAERRETITYQALGQPLGITGRALQNFDRILAPIKYYCLRHGLPQLSALVVRKDSGLPGTGAEANELDIDQVFNYNWRGRSPMIPSETELAVAMEWERSRGI
jgi:putative restriction endonuclease